MSDWGATHSMSLAQGLYREMPTSLSPHLSPSLPISPVGLDQEMPGADFMNAAAIEAAFASGEVDAARIDDAALRILTPLFGVGAFDINNTNTQRNNVSTPARTPRSGTRVRVLQPAPERRRVLRRIHPHSAVLFTVSSSPPSSRGALKTLPKTVLPPRGWRTQHVGCPYLPISPHISRPEAGVLSA